MTNPLLEFQDLPPFSQIRAEHVEPAVDALLAENRSQLRQILERAVPPTWSNLMQPLEAMNDRLARVWSPIGHLNAVLNSDELRTAYTACLPKLSDYWTELGQHETLCTACQALRDGPEYAQLDRPRQRVVDNALRDFRLSGVDLDAAKKDRYRIISEQLSQLGSNFSDNVLDSTNAWQKHVTSRTLLSGLPESALAVARQNAERLELDGWLLNLDLPCYLPVMTFADDRGLRRELYEAFATRASERGPGGAQFDNTDIMDRILALRHERARLLGFSNHAERSLATKMAESPEQVLTFLEDLAARSRPQAQREYDAVLEFARTNHGVENIESWDVMYFSEKLRQSEFAISQEELRPYFPENRVVPGLFSVAERLFRIRIRPLTGVDVWHPDVRAYEVLDDSGDQQALFYLDLYARPKKRGGAWMDECRCRRGIADGVQTPVAYLTCNFTPPVGDRAALFTHNEVTTLFHEFGHGLHHMLTRIDVAGVSGINGVEWDAVELPSQFMENWCWERAALDMISGHHETGLPMPARLLERMQAARNFQAAMTMVRQLEFALFDFVLHRDYDPQVPARVLDTWHRVRERVAVVPVPAFNRFPNAFTHIFSGGYAAGYYSYKWAEVLSADAFSAFEENGVFDTATGEAFLHNVLEVGGSRDAMESFIAFRGRSPSIDPLLRHSGIETQAGSG